MAVMKERCRKVEKRSSKRKGEIAVQKEEKEKLEKEKADWMSEKEKILKDKDDLCKEKDGLVKERECLVKEREMLMGRVNTFEDELEKAKGDAVVNFKSIPEFADAIEQASLDKFGQGYDSCQAFAAVKGFDSTLLNFEDYVAYSTVEVEQPSEEAEFGGST